MKKILAMLLALMMVLSLAACGASEAPAEEPAEAPEAEAPAEEAPAEEAPAETYTVGICQLVPHVALDAATQGFKDALVEALGDAVTFEEQNAAGDAATCAVIANDFVSAN